MICLRKGTVANVAREIIPNGFCYVINAIKDGTRLAYVPNFGLFRKENGSVHRVNM